MVRRSLSSLPAKQSGFSLLEILVAFLLIAILGATTMNALLRNNIQTLASSRQAQAMVYAREYAEMLRGFDFVIPNAEKTAWENKVGVAHGTRLSVTNLAANSTTGALRRQVEVVSGGTTAKLIVEQRLPNPAIGGGP